MKTTQTKGTITLHRHPSAVIHTYVSPETGGLVTSHIIETDSGCIVVDVQFVRECTKELLEYCQSLGKPINRIIISHAHPDHWFGLESFRDIPTYALPSTRSAIAETGTVVIADKKKIFADAITDSVTIPTDSIVPGKYNICGLDFEFEELTAAEDAHQLLIRIPSLNTLICQDIIYNDVHPYLGNTTIDGWLDAIVHLTTLKNYDTILCGHGQPAGFDVLEKTRTYLKTAKNELRAAEFPEQFKNSLIDAFPENRGSFLLDISLPMLFSDNRSNASGE